jgi:hypothetical protein
MKGPPPYKVSNTCIEYYVNKIVFATICQKVGRASKTTVVYNSPSFLAYIS